MLVDRLSLKDFKCFEEVDIEFGKITLLTGANSSGKSSLIYALLGIMQSRHFPEFFALNGKLVNMGGFEDVIRKGSNTKKFEISFGADLKKYITCWTNNEIKDQPQLIEWIYENEHIKKHVIENELNNKEEITLIITKKAFAERIEELKEEFKLGIEWTDEEDEIFKNNTFIEIKEVLDKFVIKYELEYRSSLKSMIFNEGLPSFYLSDWHPDFNYLGSFRLPPERTYYRRPNSEVVGVNGEGYLDQIIEWEETNDKLFNEFLDEVRVLGLFHNIESNKMKGGRFEFNVQVNPKSALSSLTDVGFGISQFLPIIVADFQLYAGCLAVSQPEIHLHPRIQATLGDYFARQIKKTEKQYIVETHSEYLINRLRLLIVKGELNPEDVKLYYMENDGDKTTTYKIELTTDGQIKNAPQGFFDTYEMDVMDIALFASAQ